MNSILLSFDLEEFDIPEEYGQIIPEDQKLEVSLKGLNTVLQLLQKLDIRATFYTTAFFAEANSEVIKKISLTHEIASHSFFHSSFDPGDILRSKASLERITGKRIKGFRMPRLFPVDETLLVKNGFTYNSSLNPTYLPGRYNNISQPRRPFVSNGIINLPVSVTPIFRIPLFWLSFKNLPIYIYRRLARRTLGKDNYLNIYFHPWEFADISMYRLPSYISKVTGDRLVDKLEKLMIFLKEHGEFITSNEYCEKLNKKEG